MINYLLLFKFYNIFIVFCNQKPAFWTTFNDHISLEMIAIIKLRFCAKYVTIHASDKNLHNAYTLLLHKIVYCIADLTEISIAEQRCRVTRSLRASMEFLNIR